MGRIRHGRGVGPSPRNMMAWDRTSLKCHDPFQNSLITGMMKFARLASLVRSKHEHESHAGDPEFLSGGSRSGMRPE